MKLVRLVLAIAFLGWMGHFFVPSASPASGVLNGTGKPDLQVVSQGTSTDGYLGYATGVVKNNTDHNYTYVQVEISEYDKSGNQVGSTMANTNNLDPNGTWKYKAPILDTGHDVANFQVKNVTGY